MTSSNPFRPGDRVISLSPNMLYNGKRGTIVKALDRVSAGPVNWWKIQMDDGQPGVLVTVPEMQLQHVSLIDRLAELADD